LAKRAHEYERIKDRAARGEYELVVPFDYMILEHLPEVGTLFAGMYPLGETVANIQKTLNKIAPKGQQIDVPTVYGRVRSLEIQGLVSQTRGARSKRVWQRTTRATKIYEDWKAQQKGGTSPKESQSGPSSNS
jgi:hypothetical protein